MEIILLEDVQGLGYKDDIVKVKNGYGRNYLIPYKKAVIASKSAKKVLEEKLKQRAHKLEKIKNDALALAEQLSKLEALVVATKVSPTGVIYGSVNSLQISDLLKEKGFDIDRKKIDVKDVKEIGSYHAVVHLHKEVSVNVPFNVVDENAKSPVDSVVQTILKEQLLSVIDTLTPREQKVIRLRYGIDDAHPRTLEEVGKEFNVTRERIRQIEAKALRKLRNPSRSKKLKDFWDE